MRRVVAVGALACTVGCGADPQGIRTDATTREPTWCQVQTVLEQKCQRCHTDPPDNGAPFPLVTYEDTQVVDRREISRLQRMHDAVESEYMPATWMKLDPPVQGLTANERAVILDWASAGGEPTGGTSCK
jgi:uncharacterized membrane protein